MLERQAGGPAFTAKRIFKFSNIYYFQMLFQMNSQLSASMPSAFTVCVAFPIP